MIPIPSEILEPQLTKFFGLMIQLIGSEQSFPSQKKWEAWHNMFKGVHYLVMGNRSRKDCTGVHANLAFGNVLGKIDPCWFLDDQFDEEFAKEVWKTCREVVLA